MSGWRRTRFLGVCRPGLLGGSCGAGRCCARCAGCRASWVPDEVAALMGALRTDRDRAMVAAMVLGGLRRAEVLGLRLEDLRLGEWRVFIAEGKGGHQRLVPVSPSFFATVAAYMNTERPAGAPTDRLFVVLKGPRRGQPLSIEGLDEIISAARARAGLAAWHLPRAAPHLSDPAAGGGHVDRGAAGPGRAPLYRFHSAVSALGIGLAGRGVPAGGRGHGSPGGGGESSIERGRCRRSSRLAQCRSPKLGRCFPAGAGVDDDDERLLGRAVGAARAAQRRGRGGVPAPVRFVCDRRGPQVPLRGGGHRRSCDRLGGGLVGTRRGGWAADGVSQDHRLQAGHHSPVLRAPERVGRS